MILPSSLAQTTPAVPASCELAARNNGSLRIDLAPLRKAASITSKRACRAKSDGTLASLGERRHGYLVPASGAVEVNGVRIAARDGTAIKDVRVVRIRAIEDSELVMVDVS